MRKIAFIFVTASLLFAGCSKDKDIVKDNVWIVESMQADEDSFPEHWHASGCEALIILSFIKDFMNEDLFHLEINSSLVAGGSVKIRNKKIKFELNPVIFEQNCPFAKSCAELLNEITHYETDGYKLILKGRSGEVINLTRDL